MANTEFSFPNSSFFYFILDLFSNPSLPGLLSFCFINPDIKRWFFYSKYFSTHRNHKSKMRFRVAKENVTFFLTDANERLFSLNETYKPKSRCLSVSYDFSDNCQPFDAFNCSNIQRLRMSLNGIPHHPSFI